MNKNKYDNIDEVLCSDELRNGLRIRIVPKKDFNSFYAVLAVNYGGAQRRYKLGEELIDTPAGVAHYLEHKMFDLPDGDNALSILTNNGADPNAFTSADMTAYYFQCTDKFEENLRVLLHFVTTPYFTDETVEKERGIISQEILMGEDNPGVIVYYNLLKMLYQNHPIRDRVAGTVESIAEITAQTLYDCHKAFYCPANMVLCVEGDVDPERIVQIAEEETGKKYSCVPKPDYGKKDRLTPTKKLKKEIMPVSSPQFLIGLKFTPEEYGGVLLREDLVSALTMRLLAGQSAPFYSRLYREGLLNRDFDYEVDFAAGTGTVIIGGESSDPEKVFEEFKKELERVSAEGFDERAFELAKRAAVGSRLRALEDFENVCLAFATGVFNGYNAFDAISMSENIRKEECEAFLKNKLLPNRLAMSVVECGEKAE